jgi:hypothetical protein
MQQLRGKPPAVPRRAGTPKWAAVCRVAAGLFLSGVCGAAGLAHALGGTGPTEVVLVLGLGLGIGLLVPGWSSPAPSDPESRRRGPSQPDAMAQAASAGLGDYVRSYTGTWSVDRDKFSEAPQVFVMLVLLATPPAGLLAGARSWAWLGLATLVAGPAAFLLGRRDLAKARVRLIYRFEAGFVCRGLRQAHAFRWADVADLRTVAVPVVHNGQRTGTRITYRLRAQDGRRATFAGEFGAVLAAQVARVAPSAMQPDKAAAPAERGAPSRVADEARRLGLGELQTRIAHRPHETLIRLATLTGLIVVLFLTAMAWGGATIDHDYGPAAVLGTIAFFLFGGLFGGLPGLRDIRLRSGASTRYVYRAGLVVTGWRGQIRLAVSWRGMPGLYGGVAPRMPYAGRRSRRPAPQHCLLVPRHGRPPIRILLAEKLAQDVLTVRARAVRAVLSARLVAGERLRFGPFLLSPAGLTLGTRTVSWPEVSGCELDQGVIRVSLSGSPETLRARNWHVPDAEAFAALVRSRAGRDWPGPPAPVPSAFAPRSPATPTTPAAPRSPADSHTIGTGRRDRLLSFLSPVTITRLAVTVGGGTGVIVASLIGHATRHPASPAAAYILFWALVSALLAAAVTAVALWAVPPCLACPPPPHRQLPSAPRPRWLPPGLPRSPRRLIALAVATGALGTAFGLAGPGPVLDAASDAFLTALPVVFILMLAVWAFALTQRRVLASRHRLLRHGADLLAAIPAGLAVLVLISPAFLVAQPAAGVLFPLGAWCSVRTWRLASRSRRLTVRAAADIVLSLLLGTDLVLLLVWLANLLGLEEGELAGLRRVLQQAGSVTDLPWWLWAGLYVLLASASLAIARWPGRLAAVSRWSDRLHLVPVVDAGRRTLTVVHIGLLAIVLVAVATPPGLGLALQGPLKTRYTVALQRELIPDGELAAYTQIRRQFTGGRVSPAQAATLRQVVTRIHAISSPPRDDPDATGTEDELAYGLGLLQARVVLRSPPPTLAQTEAEVTGPGAPIRNLAELRGRVAEVTAEQDHSEAANRNADQAAELAAAAVANVIQIPHLGDTEIVQVVREYLSGLIEGSPLKEVFAAWADRLAGHQAPPAAERLVVPDGAQLQQAAATAYAKERASTGQTDADDPLSGSESAAATAVDLANSTRLLASGLSPAPSAGPSGEPGSTDLGGTDLGGTEPEREIKIKLPGHSGFIELPLPTFTFSEPGEPVIPAFTAPAEPVEPEPVDPDPIEPPHDIEP